MHTKKIARAIVGLTVAGLTTTFATACSKMRCDSDANCPAGMACHSILAECGEPAAEDGDNELFFAGEGEGEGGEGEGEGITPPECPSSPGLAFERPKPNVMFVVDRSTSMLSPGECAAGSDCGSKFEQLLALGPYLDVVQGKARFGLSVFPAPSADGDSCTTGGGLLVPLTDAENISEIIVGALMQNGPNGRTPIAAALDEVEANGGLDDADRDNIVVLLTDGEPNCACTEGDSVCEHDEAVAAVQRLVDRDVSVKVDVVGFGASASAAGATLSDMAVAGGTALAGDTKYFEARSVEELVARLFELTAAAAPCRFTLDDLPAPADLRVHLDDGEVAPCADQPCSAGYSYDEGSGVVELHGATCSAIRDGECHDVWFEG